jgi:branched-chain amino acid transport system ATP-binding protein
MVDPAIECVDLTIGYGRTPVGRDINLRVDAGEVVCLLGANGAGKTTTMMTIAGEIPPLAGDVRLHGETVTTPTFKRAKAGLSFVTEERSVIMSLTAAENLRLANVPQDRAVALFPALEPLMKRTAGLLSGGEQQMLTLARALGREPRALLADELSLGLAPIIVERLLRAVRTAADDQGVGVLLVEQHIRQALAVADRVYVMQRGRIVMEGTTAEAQADIEQIERAYLSGVIEDEVRESAD